ncbi:hypothetical protein M409DRAFT_24683 [Zasmidium cellare ATCC 36951]|uniref:Uncharacterized protein n=1 Tax=Zasmidium cellare ATCC 36951 TaxID=1080233 RepID=A0A6A6CF44_ZASCE|nr:uncharacterized protein M409DRAFT_24683 [Zasmidium cellare ATCC 36951]KAF2164778.1 hypothetical protein M409DRAFT_24683 [Zasmidium cellare ATCC 36951]
MAAKTARRLLAPLIVRLQYMYHVFHRRDNPTKDQTDTSLISNVTLHISITLATVPCAKPFFVVFEGGAFRSPTDPLNTTGNSPSGPATGGSAQVGHARPRPPRLPSHQPYAMSTPTPSPQPSPAMPITWNRRQSFAPASPPAQQPKAVAKSLTIRRSPWYFKSRRITWTRRHQSHTTSNAPSSPDGSHRSSRRSAVTRFTSPFSSLRTTASRQARSELLAPRELEPRDRSQGSRLSSRSHSRTRRQSEVDWFSGLHGEGGKTRTTIGHDPEHAEEAARQRSKGSDEARRQRNYQIMAQQSFSVRSDPAPTATATPIDTPPMERESPVIQITPWAS